MLLVIKGGRTKILTEVLGKRNLKTGGINNGLGPPLRSASQHRAEGGEKAGSREQVWGKGQRGRKAYNHFIAATYISNWRRGRLVRVPHCGKRRGGKGGPPQGRGGEGNCFQNMGLVVKNEKNFISQGRGTYGGKRLVWARGADGPNK